MKCACPCGEEFEPERSNQRYINAQHRHRAENRRYPVKRQKLSPVAVQDGLSGPQQADLASVTEAQGAIPLPGTEMAQTKQQRRNEAMRKHQSSEFLSPLQVARLLGISIWSLLLWRKKGFGPPVLRVSRNIIRYPREGFEAWLAALPRT